MSRGMSMSAPLEPNVPQEKDGIPAADPGRGAPETAEGFGVEGEESDVVPGEEDVDRDDAVALSRATGGGPSDQPDGETDAEATTGTGAAGTFVGRVAGQDLGYAGETGAERRAAEQDG
jgi:hypothetical protein